MKTRLALPLAACAFSLTAHAQTAITLDRKDAVIQATVLDTCRFDPSQPGITLNVSMDPSTGMAQSTTQSLAFSCTRGFSMRVGIAGHPGLLEVARTLTHTQQTTETLPYTLKVSTPGGTTGKGFSTGNELSVQLTAQIMGGAFADAMSGRYQDTVTLELQP